MELNQPHFYTYSVLDLRDVVSRIKNKMYEKDNTLKDNCALNLWNIFRIKTNDEKDLDYFLSLLPITSNYVTFNELSFTINKGLYYIGSVVNIKECFESSIRTIGHHIDTLGLIDKCEIQLSEYQNLLFTQIQNKWISLDFHINSIETSMNV